MRLPDERRSVTHHVTIDLATDLYITVGLYPDTSKPGEVFVVVGKEGSTVRGMTDMFALQLSLLIQYGVDLADLCRKGIGVTFEPRGKTTNKEIPHCSSIPDYVFRWLKVNFVDTDEDPVVRAQEKRK